MDWTEIIITVPRRQAQTAQDVATGIANDGLYIEDYADLETQVMAIAHVDLIEQNLLDKPRDVVLIHFYLPPDENPTATMELLRARLLAADIEPKLETKGVKQEDWETAWKQYYHPMDIGRRLAVCPSWQAYETTRTVLKLDPGMAFGTGTHETTALCLEVLDEKVQGGERVLDIGTGSGILAVAALLLGASFADGIDIDPVAVRTATENATLNSVQTRFAAQAGDLADLAKGPYAIITANIIADAIIRLAPSIPALLAPGGIFVSSGIIDTREQDVVQGVKKTGLKLQNTLRKGGWVAQIWGMN